MLNDYVKYAARTPAFFPRFTSGALGNTD